jgi:hypothetical protein
MRYIGFGGSWCVAPLVVLDTMIQCHWPSRMPRKSVADRTDKSQKQYVTYTGQRQ